MAAIEVMQIPEAKAGVVIGRGGDAVRDIISRSGAQVQISREPDADGFRSVTISGGAPQAAAARQMISDRVQYGDAGPRPPPVAQPFGSAVPTPVPPSAPPAGPEVEQELIVSAGALAALVDPSSHALPQLTVAGISVHIGRAPHADGSRPVRLRGAAATVHGAKLVLERCEAHAQAKARMTPLSPDEALHRYYQPFFERAGLPYRTPQRLWQDSVDQESAQFEQWMSYYSSMGYAAHTDKWPPPAGATKASAPAAAATVSSGLPPGWREARDGNGRVYYFCEATQKTQWTPPDASQLAGGGAAGGST